MTNKLKPQLLVFCFTILSATAHSQIGGFLKNVKNEAVQAGKKVMHEADSSLRAKAQTAMDKSLDGVLSNTPTGSQPARPAAGEDQQAAPVKSTSADAGENAKRLNSELSLTDERRHPVQNLNAGYTRLKIARNLALDVKGKYPIGYEPKWRFVSYNSKLKMKVENWISPRSTVRYENKEISIGDYKGKAVLRYGAFITCDCMADIVIPDTLVVINETPQTFKVTNFSKILNERRTGEACIGLNVPHFGGGHEGQITLSSNEAGDIVMNLTIEAYTAEKRDEKWYNKETRKYEPKVFPSKVSYRYSAEGITVDNEMSPEKATAIVKAEEEAKQRQKDFLARSKKQVDSLLKLIPVKYGTNECRSCFSNERDYAINPETHEYYYVNSGRYSHSETDYNLSTSLVVKNKCSYPITFVGIQQRYDNEKGYYYVDVTKTMEANYQYESQQGMFSYLFSSLIGANRDIYLQREYSIQGATLNSIQWLKVVRAKN